MSPSPATGPKIVIDARFTRLDHHDGISRYGASLIAAVAPLAKVTMLISDERQLALLPDVPWVKIGSPLSPRELFVARDVNPLEPDLVFCPMQTMGSWGRRYPLVLTLHDLIYYEHPTPPGFLPAPVRLLWRLYHKAYWPQRLLLNRADVVATISRTTEALMRRHRLTRRPIRILGNAPQGDARPRDPAAGPEKSLVYMGSFMPYKNVETLLAGMADLPAYTLHLLSRITPERRRELERLIPAGARVVFSNGVTDAEYDRLLKRATALVTLSRAEGYGLPLVEAMAVGTPVVVADTPIFREVGGSAALYVPAGSAAAFARAVHALDDPAEWAARSVASLTQAGTFSWETAARELLTVAQELQDGRTPGGRKKGTRGGRVFTVSDSAVVAADPLQLYQQVSDVRQMGRWSPENHGATVHGSDGAPTVGMVFDGRNTRGRFSWTTRCTVTAAEPGQRFAFRVYAIGARVPRLHGPIASWEYRFEAVPGGTRVTETWTDDRRWPAPMIRVFDALVTGGTTFARFQRRNIRTTLRNLQARAGSGNA